MPGASSLLWVDQHRPTSFDQLDYHAQLNERLRGLCEGGDLPHLLLYGPSGAGKRTRVGCILRELFGMAAERRKVAHKVFKLGDNRKELEVTTVTSAHHIEVNPSDSGINDRLVVQELIKDMASNAPLDFQASKRKSLKVIVLHEVDQMTRLAQQALRRTMEKYTKTCRIIMVCDSVTKVIEPLRSRCLGIRVAAPTESDIAKVLTSVGQKEGLKVATQLVDRLVKSSDRNLRRALLQLEATKVAVGQLELPSNASIQNADWEFVCFDIVTMIRKVQSATQLKAIRTKLNDLLSHAVPADVILRHIQVLLLPHIDDEISGEICKVIAKFDHNLAKGTKPIFHLEACIARIMQVLAAFNMEKNAMMVE